MFNYIFDNLLPVLTTVCENPLASVQCLLSVIQADLNFRASVFTGSATLISEIKLPVSKFVTECLELHQIRDEALAQLNIDRAADITSANTLVVNSNGEITPKNPSALDVEQRLINSIYDLRDGVKKYELVSQIAHLGYCLVETIRPNLEEFGQNFQENTALHNNRFCEIHAQYVARCAGVNQEPPNHEEGIGEVDEQDNDDQEQEQDNDEQEQDNDPNLIGIQYACVAIPPPPPTLDNIIT